MKIKVKHLKSFRQKTFGYLLNTQNRHLFIQTRFGVHSFFMRKSMEIILLDDNFEVLKVKKLVPWRIFLYNPKYKNILEMASGSINKHDLQIGKRVDLYFDNH